MTRLRCTIVKFTFSSIVKLQVTEAYSFWILNMIFITFIWCVLCWSISFLLKVLNILDIEQIIQYNFIFLLIWVDWRLVIEIAKNSFLKFENIFFWTKVCSYLYGIWLYILMSRAKLTKIGYSVLIFCIIIVSVYITTLSVS